MGDMTLHWSPRSPFVRKVMVAAHELGLTDRLTLRRTVAQMTKPNPDLLPDNPLSKIPTLVLADGSALIDSGLICEYLDSLAGGGVIIPAKGPERWAELSRHALATGLLDLLILWRNERNKPPEKQTAEWLSSFATKASTCLARFEIEAGPIAPGPLPLSGIALGCCLSYLDFRFADLDWRTSRPRLARWHGEFRQRPSAIATEIKNDG
ncbi:Glutathione S-transferase [Bosea sp. 62]|uniref:glutathione S-transferase family protein n=2 Tax=unclassified Bosea (in: a-proteobacteria) TaxID=2653178 RepID=UPI0012570B88|nr:Glutathione S-transferase [Bosea sp. 21B]CAD5294361.1 Glutathione S-transferase [Bosea sp. 46]CAD5299082.1 Glutathione S-transferase [Bosea sp. 7B]VVT60802.1 Glutathione S-transferase [Bosea sp. EC-HK365B]VXB40867.1 Glutathione S-transferase [Bosea sp. 127]VXB53325.1 Glutathione S-transferase [Bosea sp. 125]VXC74086.1 Glutathione S-transferase [Bosea sp. 29B]VXC92117.1 Glutathione S-transferase [Bosea sp. 62]